MTATTEGNVIASAQSLVLTDVQVGAPEQKIRFHSPDTHRLTWKAWSEMSPAEQAYVREKYPHVVPDTAKTGDTGRYADLIAYYEARRDYARQIVRTGHPGVERGHAAGAAIQYQQAIDNLREAEQIAEPADVWFAVAPGELRNVRIAPVLFGPYVDDMDPSWVINTQDHVVRLSSPIHIAWMRRLMREGSSGQHRAIFERKFNPDEDLEEQRLYPLIHPDSGEITAWGSRSEYQRGVAGRQFRG